MPKYTLTMTKKQAEVVSLACEVFARLETGQFKMVLEYLPLDQFLPEGWHDDMAEIGRILQRHMIGQIDGHFSSLGIAHHKTGREAKIAWDIHQVVRHRLAWDRAVKKGVVESPDSPRKWPEMIGACYDEPLQVAQEPLAKIDEAKPRP